MFLLAKVDIVNLHGIFEIFVGVSTAAREDSMLSINGMI